MNVICTHCAHEFEMDDEALSQTGGSTRCPSCGGETGLGSVPSGATLPWHPGQAGMPPMPGEGAPEPVADPGEAAPEPKPAPEPEPAPAAAPRRKDQSVLFKLGGIQALAAQTAARQGEGPPEASGLIDIRMLAATIGHHEDEMRAAHNVQFVGRVEPSGPVALPTSSPGLATASAETRGKAGLIAAAVVFLVLIVAAIVLVYFVYLGKKPGGGDGDRQASAAMSAMTPSMGAGVVDAGSPAMRAVVMDPGAPAMRPLGMDAMEPAMTPAIMKPDKPKKRPRKLYRKHIKAGVATVADRIAGCKKDRKGRFKLRITVAGKTGKVKRVYVSGRRQRKSKTGKCLKALFGKAQFTPFKRRQQAFTHRVRIK